MCLPFKGKNPIYIFLNICSEKPVLRKTDMMSLKPRGLKLKQHPKQLVEIRDPVATNQQEVQNSANSDAKSIIGKSNSDFREFFQ
jgi:hypothetical protein